MKRNTTQMIKLWKWVMSKNLKHQYDANVLFALKSIVLHNWVEVEG